jgi:hypothetical protein
MKLYVVGGCGYGCGCYLDNIYLTPSELCFSSALDTMQDKAFDNIKRLV